MAYQDHFRIADDMITHLDSVVGGIADPFISSRYVGFVSLSAVTVYELAIKEIFCSFAAQKHSVLETFVLRHFERINGRIKLRDLREDHILRFGKKYVDKFKVKIDDAEKRSLSILRVSISSSYTNIIEWRHQFVHQGQIPSTVSYPEVVTAYKSGKEIIHCLSQTMRR